MELTQQQKNHNPNTPYISKLSKQNFIIFPQPSSNYASIGSSQSLFKRFTPAQDRNDCSPLFPRQTQLNLLVDSNYNFSLLSKEKMIKKERGKSKKKNQSDYKKNICGYITKKVIREFIGFQYDSIINKICQNVGCRIEQAKQYYKGKIQHVTGPSHIPGLLNGNKQINWKIKRAFGEFMDWFLKSRYLRYLLIQGKMNHKRAYVEFKNTILMDLLRENLLHGEQNQAQSSVEVKIQVQYENDSVNSGNTLKQQDTVKRQQE